MKASPSPVAPPFHQMNAPRFDSPDAPRSLAPEIEKRISVSLKAHAHKPTDETSVSLRTALAAAARDARERGILSEELVLIFKAIEHSAGIRLADDEPGNPNSRSQIVRALLDAYYSRDQRRD